MLRKGTGFPDVSVVKKKKKKKIHLPVQEMPEMQFLPLGQEDPLEEEMVNSSLLTCIIPWTEEPDGLQKMGSQRVGLD